MLIKKILRSSKSRAYFEEKLKENTSNPKSAWKTLKQFGLPEKRSPSADTCLKIKEGLSEVFKKLYSTLAHDLVKKFPTAA